MKSIKSTKITCKFCGYEWETLSQLKNVNCPSCIRKNPNPHAKPSSTANSSTNSFLPGGVKPTISSGADPIQEKDYDKSLEEKK